MSMNDLMSDFVARIHNAVIAGNATTEVLKNNLAVDTCKKLTTLGYFNGFEDNGNTLTVNVKLGSFSQIKRVSKPGQRVYCGYEEFPKIIGGIGFNLITTSQGVMTNIEAKKLKLGGEVLFQIY